MPPECRSQAILSLCFPETFTDLALLGECQRMMVEQWTEQSTQISYSHLVKVIEQAGNNLQLTQASVAEHL